MLPYILMTPLVWSVLGLLADHLLKKTYPEILSSEVSLFAVVIFFSATLFIWGVLLLIK